jgi:hypothetical protein
MSEAIKRRQWGSLVNSLLVHVERRIHELFPVMGSDTMDLNCVTLELFGVVTFMASFFWDMTPRHWVTDSRRFEGKWWLNFHGYVYVQNRKYLSVITALYLQNFQYVSAELSSHHQGVNRCRQ